MRALTPCAWPSSVSPRSISRIGSRDDLHHTPHVLTDSHIVLPIHFRKSDPKIVSGHPGNRGVQRYGVVSVGGIHFQASLASYRRHDSPADPAASLTKIPRRTIDDVIGTARFIGVGDSPVHRLSFRLSSVPE